MEEMKQLDEKGLRRFGLTTGLIVAALFGLAWPLLRRTPMPRWPWIIAGLLCLFALIAPAKLDSFYRIWMRAGGALGRLNTRVILGALWCAVFTPLGAVMRLSGRDPLSRRLDPGAKSYRVPSRILDRKNMEEPF